MQKMLESNKYNAGCMEINHPAKGNALKVNPLLNVTKDWTDSVKERYEKRILDFDGEQQWLKNGYEQHIKIL
jgi:hypothetical protein